MPGVLNIPLILPPPQQSLRYYSNRPINSGQGRGRGLDRQRDNYEWCCWLCGHLK